MATRKIIGDAWVELRGDSKKFRKDIQDAVTLDKRTEDQLAKNLQDSFDKAFDKLSTDKLMDKLSEVVVKLEIDTDHFRTQVQALNQIIDDEIKTVKINVEIDDEAFNGVKKRLTEEIEHVEIVPVLNKERAEETEDDLDEVAKGRSAQVSPDYNTLAGEYVAARIAWLTRPRQVKIITELSRPHYDEVLLALSGFRMLDKVRESLWNIVKDLDKAVPKIMLMTGAFGYLSSVVLTAANNVFSIAYDTGRIAALALPLPGIFAGMAIGAGATVAAFKDFNEVLPFVSDQLGVIQDKISEAFWAAEAGGDRIESATRYILDMMERELPATGAALGEFFGSLGASIEKIFTADVFSRLFGDLNESILISATYTDAWVNAMRILGELGSAYLPRLATWAGKIGEQFESWLIAKEDSGELVEWVEGGIVALHQFWDVLKNTGGVLKDFAQLAHEAGGSTLVTLNEALLTIRETISDPTFRENFIGVFRGARDMMEEVAERSGPAFKTAMDSLAKDVIYAFDNLGTGVGDVLKGLFEGLSTEEFSAGFRAFIDGVSEGLSGLGEYLPSVMEGFGALLEIIGALAENFGPLLGRFLEVVAELLIELKEPIIDTVESLTDFLHAILELNPQLLLFGTIMGTLVFKGLGLSLSLKNVGTALVALYGSALGGKGAVVALQNAGKALLGVKVAATTTAATTAAAGAAIGTSMTAPMGVAGAAAGGLAGKLGLASLAAVAWPAAAVVAGGAAVLWGTQLRDTTVDVEGLTDELGNIRGPATRAGDQLIDLMTTTNKFGFNTTATGKSVETFGDALDTFSAGAAKTFGEGISGWFNTLGNADEAFRQQAETLDQTFADMIASGNIDEAQAQFEQWADAAMRGGATAEEVAELFPQATAGFEENTRIVDMNTDALGRNTYAVEAAAGARALADSAVTGSYSAQIDYNNAMESFNEVLNRNGRQVDEATGKLRLNTKEGQENFRVIEQMGRVLQDKIDVQIAETGVTEDALGAMRDYRSSLEENAYQLGMSREEAAEYAQAVLDIPDEAITTFLGRDEFSDLSEIIEDKIVHIDGATGTVFINGDIASAQTALELVNEILPDRIDIPIDLSTPEGVQETLDNLKSVLAARGIDVPAHIDLETMPAEEQITTLSGLLVAGMTDVEVGLDTGPGSAAIGAMKGDWDRTEFETKDLLANRDAASAVMGDFANEWTRLPVPAKELEATTDAATNTVTTWGDNISSLLPPEVALPVDLNDDPARGTGEDLLSYLNTSTGIVGVTADTGPGREQNELFMALVNGSVGTGHIGAEDSQGEAKRVGWLNRTNLTTGVAKIDGDSRQAESTRVSIRDLINRTEGTVNVKAVKDTSTWNTVQNAISGLSRTVTVWVRSVFTGKNADGNIYPSVKSFAAGGLENHIAQIAPPSSMLRVWAEPETGGEAYIPLALSKRLRSLKILEDVAKIFGYMLVPNMKKFADGGLFESVALPSRSTTPISTISPDSSSRRSISNSVVYNISMEINASDLEGIRSIEQFVQTVRRRTRQGIG